MFYSGGVGGLEPIKTSSINLFLLPVPTTFCYRYLLPTVVGRWKNTQIYITKLAKKMFSGKCNSREFVLGEEHTAWRLKFKNLS
jgi:hypothetical protein